MVFIIAPECKVEQGCSGITLLPLYLTAVFHYDLLVGILNHIESHMLDLNKTHRKCFLIHLQYGHLSTASSSLQLKNEQPDAQCGHVNV